MQTVEKVYYNDSSMVISNPPSMNPWSILDRKELIKVLNEKNRTIVRLKLKLQQLDPEGEQEFLCRLKKQYPNLSSNDLRICTLLRQNLSTKEVAQNLAIGADSANKARYRIRKKLGLSRKDDLIQFILVY